MTPSLYERLALDQERAHCAVLEAERREREFARMRCKLAGLQLDLAILKLRRALRRHYRQDQPRVPAGNPGGGQWTSEGGGAGRNDPRVISDATPDNTWKPGAQYAQNTDDRRYSGVNLEEEDVRGGHGKRDHVEKTHEDLIKKLNSDWRRLDSGRLQITRYLPAEGSFSSLIQANDFVNQTLRGNQKDVDAVATGQKETAMLERRFGYVTGYEA